MSKNENDNPNDFSLSEGSLFAKRESSLGSNPIPGAKLYELGLNSRFCFG
jgi:hypothetical protein